MGLIRKLLLLPKLYASGCAVPVAPKWPKGTTQRSWAGVSMHRRNFPLDCTWNPFVNIARGGRRPSIQIQCLKTSVPPHAASYNWKTETLLFFVLLNVTMPPPKFLSHKVPICSAPEGCWGSSIPEMYKNTWEIHCSNHVLFFSSSFSSFFSLKD